MFDLDAYVNRVTSEHVIDIPTDSHFTRFDVKRNGLEVQKIYDVEPVLERCAFLRQVNGEANGFTRMREMRHIGLIPTHVILQIIKAADGDQKLEEKFIKKWLRHNPEFLTVKPRSF